MPIDPERYHRTGGGWGDRDPWDIPERPLRRPTVRPPCGPEPQRPGAPEPARSEPVRPPIPAARPVTPPPRPPAHGRRRRRARPGGTALVLIILFLLIGAITAALMLDGGDSLTLNPRGKPFLMPEPTEWVEPDDDAPTTIARAAVGGGVTVTLQGTPLGQALSFQAIYQKVIPSIVSIRTEKEGGVSLGTGVVLSADGYLVTNAHVISGGSRVDVTLLDDREYQALLVGSDSQSDLAVLKINAEGLTPAEFGDSDLLQVGDVALAVGNPLGEQLRGTLTDGIISAINRDMYVDTTSMVLIQTTAALNSGNSGGALLNQYGQVVGITNMKMSSYYDTIEGLGFAIPSTTVKAVADDLIALGHVTGRPTIGVTVRAMGGEEAEELELPEGLLVAAVEKKSDAYAQGVREGDVIVEADGRSVLVPDDLNGVKGEKQAGETITLKIYRDGKYRDVTVTLVEQYTLSE